MAKLFQVYGLGQALLPVLPPPLPFKVVPSALDDNYEIGQIGYTTASSPSFYIYAGQGTWDTLSTSASGISSVLGTTNQINVSTVSSVATVSLPSAITCPGSLATTTSLSATTSVTAGTTVTATLGNITATNGNLVLGTAGNKLIIPSSIGTGNTSCGTSASMANAGSTSTVTVNTTAFTPGTSLVLFSRNELVGTPGEVSIVSTGIGFFTLSSTSSTETSTFNWLIIN